VKGSCNFLELCDLVLLPATPCCHLSSMFCMTVSPMPYFLMAAAMPEYSTMSPVCCACGATVPYIPACWCGGLASLSSSYCGGMPAGGAWSVTPPPKVNRCSPLGNSSCTPPLGCPKCPATFGADALSPLSTSAQDRLSFLVEERLEFGGDVQPDGWHSPPTSQKPKIDLYNLHFCLAQ